MFAVVGTDEINFNGAFNKLTWRPAVTPVTGLSEDTIEWPEASVLSAIMETAAEQNLGLPWALVEAALEIMDDEHTRARFIQALTIKLDTMI